MKLSINNGLGIRQQLKSASSEDDLNGKVKELVAAQESGKLADVPSRTQARWDRVIARKRKELAK